MKFNHLTIIAAAIAVFFQSCNSFVKSDDIKDSITNKVQAEIETEPMNSGSDDDAADDPAIWINPNDASKSVVIGTNKKGGLAVYDLTGHQLNYYQVGKVNNTDVLYNFPLSGDTSDIVGASNRSDSSITLMRINRQSFELNPVEARKIVSQTGDVYGFCFYKSPLDSKFYAFINSKEGKVEQWELFDTNGKIDAKLSRSFSLSGQIEGMVCDNELGHLYIGEEQRGIWKYNAEPYGGDQRNLIQNSDTSNKNMAYDIEGLAIYYAPEGQGYLIASSQGNFSYAIFERGNKNKYLTSFRIVSGNIDGVEETDGLDVTNISLGTTFNSGLFVVQDGYNYDKNTKRPQNFKFISWDKIAAITDPPLMISPFYKSKQ
jgi:3-phytase